MRADISITTLIGRMTRDPELVAVSQTAQKCNFSVAVNRVFGKGEARREEVSYFDIEAWGRLGEIVHQFGAKGKQLAVTGELIQQRYTNKDGEKRSKIVVNAREVQFLDRPEGGQSEPQYAQPASPYQQ